VIGVCNRNDGRLKTAATNSNATAAARDCEHLVKQGRSKQRAYRIHATF
jgi:hypothetical protein